MLKLVKFILIYFVHFIYATKIGCGNEYDTSSWDFDAFKYYFLPSNIEKTLYCIEFDRNRLTNEDESATLHETGGLVHRSLSSFEYLDEETNLLYFREIFHFIFYNQQLNINKSLDDWDTLFKCNDFSIEIPPRYAGNFLPDLALDQWSKKEFSRFAICPFGYIYVKPNVNDITKQFCQIELYSYPFDKHTCEVSFVFGKFYSTGQEILFGDSPIENNTNLMNPGWTIQVSTFSETKVYNHRALTFYFILERKMAGILMHFYLPSLILCLASTLSLFIHHDLLPARMSLSVTSCLSLVTLIMGAK